MRVYFSVATVPAQLHQRRGRCGFCNIQRVQLPPGGDTLADLQHLRTIVTLVLELHFASTSCLYVRVSLDACDCVGTSFALAGTGMGLVFGILSPS